MKNADYISGALRIANPNQPHRYTYFLPNKVPRILEVKDLTINRLLEDATHSLGELNAYARFVPDIDFFIRMHETKEATASSRIEGTQTNIDEALMREEDVLPERRDDWHEVQNYIKAMAFATANLSELPIVSRLLNGIHKVLLQGVRGSGKQPGTVRTSQNWIGGATLADAIFIPPHQDYVPALLSDLENYINTDDQATPLLLKACLAHYQFETIHPYLDGNGRLGRLLIILYLKQQKLLGKPVLYLSTFFENHKQEYYDALSRVRTHNDIEHWIKFFLVGISDTSKSSINTLQAIMRLREEDSSKLLLLGRRAQSANRLLVHLYSNPIMTVSGVAKVLDISNQAANTLVKELVRINILNEVTGFSRNRMFVYSAYLALFENTSK